MFKRGERWYLHVPVRGGGHLQRSTGTTDRRLAGRMRAMVAALRDERKWAALELVTSGRADLGAIAIGCALCYLHFRFADKGWRTGRPKLAAWADAFAARPSMASTAPPKA